MPDDVIEKIIAANDLKNGTVVTGVDPLGNYKTLNAKIDNVAPSGAIHSRYTNRFDDPTYYTA